MLSEIFQKLLHPGQGWMQPWRACAALSFFLIMRSADLVLEACHLGAREWGMGDGNHTALSTILPSKPAPAFDACWGVLVDLLRQEAISTAPLKSWTNGLSLRRPLNSSWNNWCLAHSCSDPMTETEAQLRSPTSQLADHTLLAASHWLQAKQRCCSSSYIFVIVQCYPHLD